ncbi:MAG: TIR domain-containing protein [Leptolyngbyaceae cyanobacterium MO_188.B28]|nr:TIR domain-containing protein [Leptolyngbyaceae cyanobacterium MO_188.B28]
MDFENDIFISYAHLDNAPLPLDDRTQGWVSNFHTCLDAFLGEYLGRKPKIWRDRRLESNTIFADEIIENLLQAAVLVSVLSPRYVQSEWCIRELQRFNDAIKQAGLDRIANKSRIFKVEKWPVDRDEYPDALDDLKEQLGCQFFETDPSTESFREFRVEFGEEAKRRFLLRVSDLAKEITKLLKEIQKYSTQSSDLVSGASADAPPTADKTIYLALTTLDLQEARETIRREFEERGYRVLPHQSLPLNAPDLYAVVREQLQQCRLSIHLIGENYGFVPEGTDQSVIALQNQLAAEHQPEKLFSRLIWLPPGLPASTDLRQQTLVNQLLNTAEAQQGAEVLQVPLEELKTVILDMLTQPKSPPAQSLEASAGSENLRIYLDCDEQDLDSEQLEALYESLEDAGYEVLLPNFDSDGVASFVDDGLKLCDSALIYYGHGNELWLQRRLSALRKVAGYAQAKPLLAKGIYVVAPATARKRAYDNPDVLVMKGFDAFSSEVLQPFLNKLQSNQEGMA